MRCVLSNPMCAFSETQHDLVPTCQVESGRSKPSAEWQHSTRGCQQQVHALQASVQELRQVRAKPGEGLPKAHPLRARRKLKA